VGFLGSGLKEGRTGCTDLGQRRASGLGCEVTQHEEVDDVAGTIIDGVRRFVRIGDRVGLPSASTARWTQALIAISAALHDMLMEATVPTTHRWIPKGMTVSYLQKATTSLRATARVDVPDFRAFTGGTEFVVPVSVTDRHGVEVVHADITTWVTPAE
jgi:hypothetical protein